MVLRTQVGPQGWGSDSCECSSVIALQVPAARLILRLDCLNECSTTDWAGLSVFFLLVLVHGVWAWEFEKLGERAGNFGSNGPLSSPQQALCPLGRWGRLDKGSPEPVRAPTRQTSRRASQAGQGGSHRTVDEILKGTQVV